jgi:S-adenosylmethionine hydrolase
MAHKKITKVKSSSGKNGLIALLTDFGSRDHYVGTMKGVVLSINPNACIVDITHDSTPHNIQEAAYHLWASYRYFPERTVFVAIVDPGVGTGRKIVCVENKHHTFIAPENGLLDPVVADEGIRHGYEIKQLSFAGKETISRTFHGRDIFAPLAALLSMGKHVNRFGKAMDIRKPASFFFEGEQGTVRPSILHIDRFGNIVTNIPERFFESLTISVGMAKISRHIHNYSEAPENHPCLIVGSDGLVEIVLKESSAARALRADLSTPISVLKND